MKAILWISLLCVLGTDCLVSQNLTNETMTAEQRHSSNAKNVVALAEPFEARTYVNSRNDSLPYRLLIPENYDSSKNYPLVLCLSGSGGRGNDNLKQIAGCWPAQVLSKAENREKHPSFVLVPQCPVELDWGDSPRKNSDSTQSKLDVKSLVFEIIYDLEKEFNIDSTRRYVTGQSMGGFGTWDYILTYPKMFAAAIPVCGGGNPKLAINIIDLPIWVFHGEKDKVVPVRFSRNMVKAIEKAGGNPKYNELRDAGHVSWPLAFDTPGLLDWLFAQKNKN